MLGEFFSKAELDNAMKAPYASQNLPVLQKMLSLTETIRLMSSFGMEEKWAEAFAKTVRQNAELHKYHSALARNRKMCERYQLSFDSDGLIL